MCRPRPAEGGALQRLHREAVALRLLSEVVGAEAQTGEALTRREQDALRDARADLLRELREPPSASELARQAGMDLRRFLRAFETLHGASPAQLVRRKRLEEARRLLEAGELSLKEIAWRVGYGHVNNFIAAFADEFGQPPRRFQRRNIAAE